MTNEQIKEESKLIFQAFLDCKSGKEACNETLTRYPNGDL